MNGSDKEFNEIADEILESEEFQKMKSYRHHNNRTVYSHSLSVAEKSFRFCKKRGLKVDLGGLVRGALLHDYFLYNHHYAKRPDYRRINCIKHLFSHPKEALENAKRKYPSLSETERDIIRHHMFPLTLIPPHTKEGWIVCYFDKAVTLGEYFKPKSRNKKTVKK